VRFNAGHPVRIVLTKWGGRPHSSSSATYLGTDSAGEWLGTRQGTPQHRADATYDAECDYVTLLPDAPWRGTFFAAGFRIHTYVDITTVRTWNTGEVTAVDLDYDVVRLAAGQVLVVDADEFAVNHTALGYPADVVRLAQESCAWAHQAVRAGTPPFDGSHERWLAELGGTP
jgi:hypothetical protein